MGTLNRESFVLLLFTLASYRQPLPTAALSGITAIVSQHMGRMSSRELSQSMWAVAKLGHMDADMMDLATTVLPFKLKYAVPQVGWGRNPVPNLFITCLSVCVCVCVCVGGCGVQKVSLIACVLFK
jgi:hypothetical protein